MRTKFEIERASNGDWYWKAKRNGKIICDGAEGYKRRGSLLKSLRAFLASVQKLQYDVDEE